MLGQKRPGPMDTQDLIHIRWGELVRQCANVNSVLDFPNGFSFHLEGALGVDSTARPPARPDSA